MNQTLFHFAVPVSDLKVSREFYGTVLGFSEGRSSDKWVDLNFFGHQFVIHHVDGYKANNHFNSVDKQDVPVPHFGCVLEWNQFWDFVERLKTHEIKFQISPYIRFEGKVGEQATMFFYDPSGNALEFKAFKDINQIFKS
jgi:hypothetical protein